MANSTEQVPLPHSVRQLLDSICEKQNLNHPDSDIRQKLTDIGEEEAIRILSIIASNSKPIRSLSGFIIHLIKPPFDPRSPSKALCTSPNSSPGYATRRMIPLGPESVAATHSPVSEKWQGVTLSPALVALGELEFRKAFLLLSYIGGEKVENAIPADEIRSFKDWSMGKFEAKVWEAVGQKYISEKDRQLSLEWDSGKTHNYYCHVSSDGSLRFKGPCLDNTRTHLQKSLGDENVLIVKFDNERHGKGCKTNYEEADALYRKFGKEGIHVGLHLYQFFVFKDGGKEEKKKDPTTSSVKCYFIRMKSAAHVDERKPYILSNKTIFEARSLFMHAHTLANLDKYMARFSLILSKTITLDVDLASVDIQTIPDVCCQDENGKIVYDDEKARIHTDGTGFISEDLALLCPKNVFKGRHINNETSKSIPNLDELQNMAVALGKVESTACEAPLLIQFRLFHLGRAIKGTVLVNKKLPPRTIQIRPSMIKVETDSDLSSVQSINSMEIVGTSCRPKRTYLSRNLIALLNYGGVPNEYFMDMLRSALEDAKDAFSNKRVALRVSINHGEMDEFFVARMILCGVPLDEPFLQYRLSTLAKEEMKSLRGGKLHVPQCYYLMGTVDPTGCLQQDQVCIILEDGQVSGDVLVYRNPGLHFGDIHILKARYVEELESFVGHEKYAIFFPCVGSRSLADEIAGGDFDGDMYWISTNPQLLKHFRKSDPWIPNSLSCNAINLNSSVRKPSALSSDRLEDELFRLFLATRFQPSYTMSAAADSWMVLMDRLLTLREEWMMEKEEKEHLKQNILKLIDIYYEAIDAPKKGGIKVEVPKSLKAEMFPHYMEKDNSFTSTSILGRIYDEVIAYETRQTSVKEIIKLPCFDVEVPESCKNIWRERYENYRKDMVDALGGDPGVKNEAADGVFKKYKQFLYSTMDHGASELEDSLKKIEDIYIEALVIYHLAYDKAIKTKKVGYCTFAWKVAGSALLRFYVEKQSERTWFCVPSVLREIFC